MGWVSVLGLDELPENARKVVKAGQKSVLLLHHQSQIYAVDSVCPHLKLPLQKGKITEDRAIVCPWHKSAFDLQDGTVKTWTPWPPGVGKVLGMISSEKTLPVFATRIEDGQIWIQVEE